MRKLTALIMLILFLFASAWGQIPNLPKSANDQGNEQSTTAKISSGVHELTAQDLEAFLDGIVPLQLERDDIAGATIAVVKDGKLLL